VTTPKENLCFKYLYVYIKHLKTQQELLTHEHPTNEPTNQRTSVIKGGRVGWWEEQGI